MSRKQNLALGVLIESPVNLPVGLGPFHLSALIKSEQVVLLRFLVPWVAGNQAAFTLSPDPVPRASEFG